MADEEEVVKANTEEVVAPQLPPPRRPSGVHSVGAYSRRGGDDLATAVWALGGPLSLTMFASIVQAVAAITFCLDNPLGIGDDKCKDVEIYTIALGVVSAGVVAGYLLVFTFSRESLPEKSMMYISAFLFLWWFVGVIVTTFGQIAGVFGTVFFATWAGLIFSGMILQSEWEQFRSVVSKVNELQVYSRSTFFLLAASIIETISAAFACDADDCNGTDIFGLVAGTVSIVLCGVLLQVDSDKLGEAKKFIVVFLVLWWSISMAVLTIVGPFVVVGNGFFSTWGAFLSSFFVAQAVIFPASTGAMNADV